MNYARSWQRLLGWVVDFIITFPIAWLIHKSSIGRTVLLSQLVFMLFEGTYYVAFWLIKGASLGMLLMKIKLSTDKKSLSLWRAISRYIGLNISIFCLGLGALWMLWDKRKQTWQDKMARTFVVRVN
jgi:uncharacterized RDD family membrane protein YckC